MVARRPLVTVDGGFRQLAAGDWLTSPGGVIDCSTMTTAAAINAAMAAAPLGSTVWLGPRPSSAALEIEDTLVVPGTLRVLGAGGRGLQTVIRPGVGFTAGDPLMAAEGWVTNATDADEPIEISGIRFDIDDVAGSHGLVIYNFWSTVKDVHFVGANGAGAACLFVTDEASNGTTVSENSHSENVFLRLRFDETTNGARHFVAESNNGTSNQDGHLLDSFFAGASGASVQIGRAAGWTVQNLHLYACGDQAISLALCYGTRVLDNYVEDFGGNNVTTGPTGGYYTGIGMTFLDGRPSIVANNSVSLVEPETVGYNRATCIGLRANSGQTDARVSVVGNTVTFANSDATGDNAEAFRIGEPGDTGRTLHVAWAGNGSDPRGLFETWMTRHEPTTRFNTEPVWVRAYTSVTGTITLDAELESVQNFTCTGDTTVDPPSTLLADRAPLRLAFLASGAQRTVTFNSSIRLSTGISSRVFTVPSGEALFVALEYSSLLADWTITAATISAN